MNLRTRAVLADVELGVLANGGSKFDPSMCECDPEVGQCCRYCNIHCALDRAVRFINEVGNDVARMDWLENRPVNTENFTRASVDEYMKGPPA